MEMVHLTATDMTWQRFEVCNPNQKIAFENLCRAVFNQDFFGGTAHFHSNPNNPGVEIEPIYHKETEKRISFQSKYFTSTDYDQIERSMEKCITHYSGKLDVIYLYCNKDLTTTSKAFLRIKGKLAAAAMDIVLICNQSIIESVQKNKNLSMLYFLNHGIDSEWIRNRARIALDSLGTRYNGAFNVDTEAKEYLELFLRNGNAISFLNEKKTQAVDSLNRRYWADASYASLAKAISNAIIELPDINEQTLDTCVDWISQIKESYSEQLEDVQKTISAYEQKLASGKRIENNEDEWAKVQSCKRILDGIDHLAINQIEQSLINKKTLLVTGAAGAGKSQLFANTVAEYNKAGQKAILVLGNVYLTSEPIFIQTQKVLNLNIELRDFLGILNELGKRDSTIIPVFFDGINESDDIRIWRNGLGELIRTVESLPYVKMAISIRDGYEGIAFDDAVKRKISSGEVIEICHRGFAVNSIEAIKTFMNHYNIPFLPDYALQEEMHNPLFLMLFCETYAKDNVELFHLFDRYIEKKDAELLRELNADGTGTVLQYLLDELVEKEIVNNRTYVTKIEMLQNIEFWRTFGFQERKLPFLAALERNGVLCRGIAGDTEIYYIAYNLLDDYWKAKALAKSDRAKDELINYLLQYVLKVDTGILGDWSGIAVAAIACCLREDRTSEDYVEHLLQFVHEPHGQEAIITGYLETYHWRNCSKFSAERFYEFIKAHHVAPENLWPILIANSTKEESPINAVFLHRLLLKQPLNHRDYLWTIYINDMSSEGRVWQLIEYFEQGNSFLEMNTQSIELMLTLFGWLLTSSNRRLRDQTSKAIVEILCRNFDLCMPFLEKFENVDDPYVLQRLYCCVFGACIKRTDTAEKEYEQLALYVYNAIFNKPCVYEDILLRDSARLIIERWLYEFPSMGGKIELTRIRPPYGSVMIPTMQAKEYYISENATQHYGRNAIALSMHPNGAGGAGMYGDFGRYIFQANVEDFRNVSISDAYYYAMDYIFSVLGYKDELFSKYDSRRGGVDRFANKRTERIGKKYQWIAMYHVMSKIADNAEVERWDELIDYHGAWEPFMRDFDPTLNLKIGTACKQSLDFMQIQGDFFDGDVTDEKQIESWAKSNSPFFERASDKLLIKDQYGEEWLALTQYDHQNNERYIEDDDGLHRSRGAQEVWTMSHAYFVSCKEFDKMHALLKNCNFMGRWFPEAGTVYQLYAGEYVWAPAARDLIDEWQECEQGNESYGVVMPATLNLRWETEQDASQVDTVSLVVPCMRLVRTLGLLQKEYNGCFYDSAGNLIAFDARPLGLGSSLWFRKNEMLRYIRETGYVLFWTCFGEKQFFTGGWGRQITGDWSGFYYLDKDGNITGNNQFFE